MPFLKKNILSRIGFFSVFLFFLLGTFISAPQKTLAAYTSAACQTLSSGSSCKPTTPGCDDIGSTATETTKGYCREAGDTTSTTLACCQKKPYCAAPNNCGSCSVYQAPVPGYICFGGGQTCCGSITCNTGGVCKGAGLCNATTEKTESSPVCAGGLDCCVPKTPIVGSCNGTGEGCVETNLGCDPATKERKTSGDAYCLSIDATHQYCCQKKTVGSVPPASDGECTAPALGGICRSTCNTGESSVGVCTASGIKCCKSAGAPGASASIPFKNPLAFDTVEGVLGSLMGALQGIIVVLSLVFIVIGAVLYITSAGDDGRMKTAKGAITASMIGLAIGIAAPSFLKQIYSILNADVCKNLTGTELANCQTSIAAITGPGTRTLTEIALSVLQFLLSIVGILGIIMLVIGGLAYLTSAGNEERADSGKKIVTYAIIGIAVALAALVIVTQIAALFA